MRLLCAAVSALCPVVFDGGLFVQHFCANRCFLSLVCSFLRQFFFIVDVRLYIFLPLNVVCCVLFFFCFKSVLFVLFIEFCVS